MHELIHQVGLTHVCCKAAQLLVRRKVASGHWVLSQLALLEYLRVVVDLVDLFFARAEECVQQAVNHTLLLVRAAALVYNSNT